MGQSIVVVTALTGLLSLVYCLGCLFQPLRSIPTVGGPSAPLLSFLSAWRFVKRGKDILEEGCRKHYDSAFKVAMFDQWLVVVCGPKMVEDLRRRPDDELSFIDGAGEFIQTQYTLGSEAHNTPYHVAIIRENLTRGLSAMFPALMDEVSVAVVQAIGTSGNRWAEINVADTMQEIVARTSNRILVGLPICRNKDYLTLVIKFAMDVVKDRTSGLFFLVPNALKPFAALVLSNAVKTVRRTVPYLRSAIAERVAYAGASEDGKPIDMLQWMVDETTKGRVPETEDVIAKRVLLINFAAIHTTSSSLTHAIYHLAACSEYLNTLREEVERAVHAHGWTKSAIDDMGKLDSFLRESQRYNGVNIISLMRKARKGVVLCDGTHIPKGTLVVADAHTTHHSEVNYANASSFDPWRFDRLRQVGSEGKYLFVRTSADYLPFGHGRHACPGRFFAACEMKAILAYIIVKYDLKFANEGVRPENVYWGTNVIPAPDTPVLFRYRSDAE